MSYLRAKNPILSPLICPFLNILRATPHFSHRYTGSLLSKFEEVLPLSPTGFKTKFLFRQGKSRLSGCFWAIIDWARCCFVLQLFWQLSQQTEAASVVRSLTNQKARKNGFLSPLGINSAVITEQLTSGRCQSEILIVFLFRKMFPSPSKIVLRSLNSSLMVIFCSPFLLLFDTVLSTSNSLHFQKRKTS